MFPYTFTITTGIAAGIGLALLPIGALLVAFARAVAGIFKRRIAYSEQALENQKALFERDKQQWEHYKKVADLEVETHKGNIAEMNKHIEGYQLKVGMLGATIKEIESINRSLSEYNEKLLKEAEEAAKRMKQLENQLNDRESSLAAQMDINNAQAQQIDEDKAEIERLKADVARYEEVLTDNNRSLSEALSGGVVATGDGEQIVIDEAVIRGEARLLQQSQNGELTLPSDAASIEKMQDNFSKLPSMNTPLEQEQCPSVAAQERA